MIVLISSLLGLSLGCSDEGVKVRKKARITNIRCKYTDGTTQVDYVLLGDYSYKVRGIAIPTSDNNKVGDTITVVVKVPISKLDNK